MLVISRRKGQRVMIGEDIEIIVTEVHRSGVKIGIRAPRGLTVLRGEVRESIELANRQASESTTDLPEEILTAGGGGERFPEVTILRRRPLPVGDPSPKGEKNER